MEREAASKADDLSEIARKREALQGEVQRLNQLCADTVARGDEVARERMLDAERREQESTAHAQLLLERERSLHEREVELANRERQAEDDRRDPDAIRAELEGERSRAASLKASVRALEQQKLELNRDAWLP